MTAIKKVAKDRKIPKNELLMDISKPTMSARCRNVYENKLNMDVMFMLFHLT